MMSLALWLFIVQSIVGPNAQHGIRGIVTDTADQELRDVLVVLHDVQTGEQRQTSSDSGGGFEFLCLGDSRYRLTFSFPGFLTQSVEVSEFRYPHDIDLRIMLNVAQNHHLAVWPGHLLVVQIRDSITHGSIQNAKIVIDGESLSAPMDLKTDLCGNAWWYVDEGRFRISVSSADYSDKSVTLDVAASRKVTIELERSR